MTAYPGLTFKETDGALWASCAPVAGCAPLDLETLRSLVKEAGHADAGLGEEALARCVERCNSATEPFELQLGAGRRAEFTLEVDADAMRVWLCLPSSGPRPDPGAIHEALGSAGVTVGIDEAAIAAACAADRGSADERILIAAGQRSENGVNASFELLVAESRDRTPQVNAEGFIDFRELGAIPTVAAEDPLMRRHPATLGSPGRNVRGEVVEALPGRDIAFDAHLIGAYVDAADRNLLRAVFSGQPVRHGNGVNVEHVLHLRNVNLATGNISFDGTVNIEGEVLPGMKVSATGDIVVGEIVDGGELEATGNIKVGGGIIAKARVRAGGSVSARFVENAHVTAGTTIAIDDTALQSELQANNQIIVGLKAPQRGRLAGGSARAMMLIRTPLLGSPTSGVTRVLLGVNPVLEERYQALLLKLEKLREEEANLDKLVKHLARQGDKPELLERANGSWQKAIKAWGLLLPERDELERELALTAGARVEVGVAVESAVDISFGKKPARLRSSYAAGSFSCEGDRVVFTDPLGKETPAV